MTTFLELLLVLTLIVVGAKLAGTLATVIGQPSVLGEILFGLLLGPSALDLVELHLAGAPVFGHGEVVFETVHLLAELGVVLLMFLAGMETDLPGLRKVGLPATSSAIGGVLLPFAGGWWIGQISGLGTFESIFLGTILTATSVSISAQTLIEMGQLRSKEGSTILGAAVIDDVIGILLLSVVIATAGTGAGEAAADPLWWIGVRIVLFFGIGLLLSRPVRWLLRSFSRLPISEPMLAGALVITFSYAWAAEALGGVAAITGAYLAGIILAQSELAHGLEEKSKALVYSLFVPIFFVDIGLQADLRELFGAGADMVQLALWVSVIAVLAKIVGSGLGALLTRFSPIESLRVGTGMVSRGEVGLIVANVGIGAGLITRDLFSVVVLMVIVTTLVTPVMLRLTFPSAAEETEPALLQ